jgi:hypothetical protein
LIVPGGPVQGENGRTGVALKLGRDSGDPQFGALGHRPFAHEVEIALNPLVVKIGYLADLQINGHDFTGLVAPGVFEGNIQDALGHGKFMHEICTMLSGIFEKPGKHQIPNLRTHFEKEASFFQGLPKYFVKCLSVNKNYSSKNN